MPIKNKTMALIRVRRTPYSGLLSFFQDVFFKQEGLALKALEILKIIYSHEVKAEDWNKLITRVFNVDLLSKDEELIIDEACIKYLGFHREDINFSKARLRGKKAYKELLIRENIEPSIKEVLLKYSKWNSAVTSYYSIINKLKALGLIDKTNGYYNKSEKFKNRLTQVTDLLNGFENETKQH
jgi:hypothetical protein